MFRMNNKGRMEIDKKKRETWDSGSLSPAQLTDLSFVSWKTNNEDVCGASVWGRNKGLYSRWNHFSEKSRNLEIITYSPHKHSNTPDIRDTRFEEGNGSPLSSLYHQRAERFIHTVLSSLRLRAQVVFFGEEKCSNTTFPSVLTLSTCSSIELHLILQQKSFHVTRESGAILHRGQKYREVSLIWKSGFRRQRVKAWKALWQKSK